MLESGQIIEVEIIDVNHMGKGVAKIDNFVMFIDGAINGDIAEVKITEKKKNYAIGKLVRLIKSSEKRINPYCNHYEKCGGCQLMHMDYKEQLHFKKDLVINELNRAGINTHGITINDTLGIL